MRRPFNGEYPMTQKFGENPDVYAQFGMKGHNGLDYGMPTGTEIVSAIAGRVIEAIKSGDSGYGKYVKIESDIEGSLTAHLSQVDVNEGQQVNEGEHLGFSGNTGFSTGPHLHWGYFKQPRDRSNGYAGYVDQLPLLTDMVSKEAYDACMVDRLKFWSERDQALAKITELEKKVVDLNSQIISMAQTIENIKNEDNDAIENMHKVEKERDTYKTIVEEVVKELPAGTDNPVGAVHDLKTANDELKDTNQHLGEEISGLKTQLSQKHPSLIERILNFLKRR